MLRWNEFLGPGVLACFSDRAVDFRLPKGSRALSPSQQEYLTSHLKIAPEHIAQIRQVHGDRVVDVSATNTGDESIPQADSQITNSAGVALVIRTADCLPVFIYDRVRKCAGLVHAGWRGSSARIAVRTIQAMRTAWGSSPADLRVVFGPAIRNCCYEVGTEFQNLLAGCLTEREGRLFCDLAAENAKQFIKEGILKENIHDCRLCTACDQRFFSHRRDGDSAGRHLSLIMLLSSQE